MRHFTVWLGEIEVLISNQNKHSTLVGSSSCKDEKYAQSFLRQYILAQQQLYSTSIGLDGAVPAFHPWTQHRKPAIEIVSVQVYSVDCAVCRMRSSSELIVNN